MNSDEPQTRISHPRHFVWIVGLALVLLAITLSAFSTMHSQQLLAAEQATSPLQEPDKVCASCHRAIYESYEQSSMARGSGIASANLIEGGFRHAPSEIDYRVFARGGAAWMSYSRPASSDKGELHGEEQLLFYIGSGHRGRTYLYRSGRQWFELPINYYTGRQTWAMAPAYDDAQHMPAPLPVDPNCLHCHTSLTQPTLATARNSYATVPFQQGGVGCGACHGDPAAHLAQHGHGAIVNPAKLDATRLDSVCVQCHLEGDAVVYRPDRSLSQFKPGDNLSDYAVYFVRASQQTGGARATSQFEALLHSACKRAAGDALTCTTCHDPHYDPPREARVAYFRARCLSCHNTPAMATHHAEQPSCAACHMPSRKTIDISHEQVTDHDIERLPAKRVERPTATGREDMVPVAGFAASDRDYGLAYAQLATHGFPGAADEARRRLTAAIANGANDEETEVRLAYLDQLAGHNDIARSLYASALQQNPHGAAALANLAVLDASNRHVQEAIRLLERLVMDDRSQTVPGMNLAWIDCTTGRTHDALAVLLALKHLNPDDPQLREFLGHGNYAGQHCTLPNEASGKN
ncbi:Cytochrome c554 and c-prime [Bryocella elongata]|uniref:Cytochrome c554 and c-prime n=1 Tax=Bryocella elongata TaxID=863522 RepID=A0A1H5U729_9BACT|nr:tetratricopeptide repeat protein [Bryocella elongata]SEF70866.1 Cytochrome c554 and c-prime [Bryocella elongata]